MTITRLIQDWRRRKVFRGAGFYLVGAWVVLQVADVVAEPAGLPLWVLTALLYLAILLFPVAVFVSWRYEWTDAGLVRTRPTEAAVDPAEIALKPVDFLVIAVLCAIVVGVGWQVIPGLRQSAMDQQALVEEAAEALENSIAVMPFDFLSGDPSEAYIATGFSDTVMHMLSQVPGLTVTARTSAFHFKDQNLPAGVIGKELNVAHLLEGSVQKIGPRLRIITRLIAANSGRELWSSNYDRTMDDLFDVQDEVAAAVMGALHSTILEDDRERLEQQYHPDLEAYQQVVLGREALFENTVESMRRARTHFERAIEIDPSYAWAHVNLAQTFHELGPAVGMPWPQALARIEALVERALELDPTLGEAWDERAKLLAIQKQFEKAEQANLRALELAPSYAPARTGRGHILMFKGDNEGYLEQLRIAAELDPVSPEIQRSLASALWANARAEEAISVLKANLKFHPEVPQSYEQLSRFLTRMGQSGEALRYSLAQRRLDPENRRWWFQHCQALWHIGYEERSIDCLDRYLESAPDDLDARGWLAGIQGDFEQALDYSEKLVKAEPNSWYRKMQYAYHATQLGRWNLCREIIEPTFPELASGLPKLTENTVWPARMLGQAMLETGDTERGTALLRATLEFVGKLRLRQAGGSVVGVEDALLLAALGEPEAALDRLEQAIDGGWEHMARATLLDRNLDSVRTDPRFVVLQNALSDNLASERAHFEEHRDEPLP